MSRRSTPERIDEARRAATRARLIGERVAPDTADAWIAVWGAQAAEDGLERGSAYWEAGWAWIAEQRLHRVKPTSLRLAVGHVVHDKDSERENEQRPSS